MKKVALYARFSSDLQNPSSADDQLALCRQYASRRWPSSFVSCFKDEALSGQSMLSRPGICELLSAVDSSDWVVVTESLDRLSRDLGDMVAIFKQLMHRKSHLVTVENGDIDYLQMGIRGTISTVAIHDMIKKVRRGQQAKAEKGLFPAGLSYGYRVVRDAVDTSGRPINGQRTIDPQQAPVVRRIFTERSAGLSFAAIAASLNADGIPSARGGLWRTGSIRDILGNPLYRGELIYNRTTLSPQRNRYLPTSPEEWILAFRDDLRIVDTDLWQRANDRYQTASQQRYQRRLERQRQQPSAPSARPRVRQHLGRLVFCGVCGSHCVLAHQRLLTCNAAKKRNNCTNFRRVSEIVILTHVFEKAFHVIRQLDLPVMLDVINADEHKTILAARSRLTQIEDEFAYWRSAVKHGLRDPSCLTHMMELERLREQLRPKAALDRLINPTDLGSDPMRILTKGLHHLYRHRTHKPFPLIPTLLPLFVDKIVMTPLSSQKKGSSLTVRFHQNGWIHLIQRFHTMDLT